MLFVHLSLTVVFHPHYEITPSSTPPSNITTSHIAQQNILQYHYVNQILPSPLSFSHSTPSAPSFTPQPLKISYHSAPARCDFSTKLVISTWNSFSSTQRETPSDSIHTLISTIRHFFQPSWLDLPSNSITRNQKPATNFNATPVPQSINRMTKYSYAAQLRRSPIEHRSWPINPSTKLKQRENGSHHLKHPPTSSWKNQYDSQLSTDT